MRGWHRHTARVLTIGLALWAAGCTQDSTTTTSRSPSDDAQSGESRVKGQMASAHKRGAALTPQQTAAAQSEAPVLQESVVPKVLLAEGHQALCLVEVGDAMPDITLPDLEGNETPLVSLFGEKLTVVFFWAADRALARAELADLSPDVAVPYSGQGVKVVGIAVGVTAESAQKHVTSAGATFPNLLDADGSAMAKVGSEKLPRTYLLDAQGKILWFDIEYSRSTRRELRQAIEFVLGEK